MGYYLEPPTILGKADWLIANAGATEIPQPKDYSEVPTGKALICVVNNGLFDAAAFAYHAREFGAFTLPHDKRPKRWLLMDRAQVEKETHFNGS